MLIKCSKCLGIKPTEFFNKNLNGDDVCDFCYEKIENQRIQRNKELKRPVNCENKTPILTGYGDTKTAKEKQRIRSGISSILDDIKLKQELLDYE